MAHFRTVRPALDEFNEYYVRYVDQAPDGDIVQTLRNQREEVLAMMAAVSTGQADHRYEPGKWSVKEVFGHIIDTEWIFAYRALRFARGDETPLPGMDQNRFMEGANFDQRDLEGMGLEFSGLRMATIQMVDSFSEPVLSRSGIASGFPFTVRALCWIIAGHCQHHVHILNERYSL